MDKIIFSKKKRRILGEILADGSLSKKNASVSIHKSSKEELMTYESKGLVVAINGSGTIDREHQQCRQAEILAKYVADSGGIIMNGGRSTGIMGVTARVAIDNYIGILFNEIKGEANKGGVNLIVSSPQPRMELLGTCAPVMVFFRGGLGTLMTLMRAIVHIRNRNYHPEQLNQMIFVNNYWIGLLSTLMNLGTLPREFIKELNFFDQADQITKKISILL